MQNTDSPVQKDPLNFIAQAFWEDYESGRPIDNGVLYEQALRECQLDGTLASLKRIDALLDQVRTKNKLRPDLFMHELRSRNLALFIGFYVGRVLLNELEVKGEWLGQSALMQHYPHLSIHPNNPFHFMALYYHVTADKVQLSHEPLFFVLEPIAIKIFGNKLKMPAVVGSHIASSLFDAVVERLPKNKQQKILSAHPSSSPVVADANNAKNINNANIGQNNSNVDQLNNDEFNQNQTSNDHQSNDSGLAKKKQIIGATDRVDNAKSHQALNQNQTSSPDRAFTSNLTSDDVPINKAPANSVPVNKMPANKVLASNSSIDIAPNIQKVIPANTNSSKVASSSIKSSNSKSSNNPIDAMVPLSKSAQDMRATSQSVTATSLTTPLSTSTPNNTTSSVNNTAVKPKASPLVTEKPKPLVRIDDFKELRADLDNLKVTQAGSISEESHKMYERASKVLRQVDKLIVKLDQKTGQKGNVKLPKEVLEMRQKALIIIKKLADAGHTGAMLRLAIYLYLGEGIKKNEIKGFELIEKAAKQGDNRGQRQLSRLHYKGLGTGQDMDLGKYWLEKAAENGHEEAAQVIQNWRLAEALIEEKKSDETSDKKYVILIGIAIFVMMIVVLVTNIMLKP